MADFLHVGSNAFDHRNSLVVNEKGIIKVIELIAEDPALRRMAWTIVISCAVNLLCSGVAKVLHALSGLLPLL